MQADYFFLRMSMRLNEKCQEHMFPSFVASPTIGYKSLSTMDMSGLFAVVALLLCLSFVLLCVELIIQKLKNTINTRVFDANIHIWCLQVFSQLVFLR
jgi:hypothetical protein